MPACNTCSDSLDCTACHTGYILADFTSPTPDTCTCDPSTVVSGNCNACSSPNVCSNCDPGYFVTQSGQCT